MSDLISKAELKRLTTKRNSIWNEITDAEGRGLDQILDSMPTVDAVPVKHGRWMPQKGGGYCCSECGSYSLDEVDGAFVHVSARTRYCHNCGARMDGEQNG